MKYVFTQSICLIAFTIICQPSVAQTSKIADNLHFTAVARDETNQPITNNTIYIRMEIFQGVPTDTNKIYCEQTPALTNHFGEFSLNFPNTEDPNTTYCAPATSLGEVDWETGDKWVKVSFQPNGNAGAPFVDIATFQFTTVPYAFAARTAERITNFDLTGASDGQVIRFDAASGTWKPANNPADNLGTYRYVMQNGSQTTGQRPTSFFVSDVGEIIVPETGTYMIMASMRVDNLAGDDFYASILVDKDGTTLFSDIVGLAEYQDESVIATRNGSTWEVAELAEGEILRLKAAVSGVGTNDYTISRGKILIQRLE